MCPTPTMSPPSQVAESARVALHRFATRPPEDSYLLDAGPGLLAAAAAGNPDTAPAARAALLRWLGDGRGSRTHWHPGLFGTGLAGHWLALRLAAREWPNLLGLADAAGAALLRHLTEPTEVTGAPESADPLGWADYDVITGPAGIALTAAALSTVDSELSGQVLALTTAALVRRCRDADLGGLVAGQYRGDPLLDWNHGRINLGLAHGATGVLLGLLAGLHAHPDAAETARRVARWLASLATSDSHGLLSWPDGAGGELPPVGPSDRQSWCYGTPGIALALWRAGRALRENELTDLAVTAFASYLYRVDPDRHLDGAGLCCGASGVALICDAFVRQAGLSEAVPLRDRLTRRALHLLDTGSETGQGDRCGLLAGSGGALTALLTLHGGTRAWLPAIGLDQ